MPLPVIPPQAAPRRRPPLTSSVEPLPPSVLDLATESVRAASEAHREALLRLSQLRDEARAAQDAAEHARAADDRAAVEAVQRGTAVPGRIYPDALAAADAAGRAVPAAEELARGTQFEFMSALNEDRDALVAAVGEALGAADAEGAQLVDQIESLLIKTRDVRLLARQLEVLDPPMARHQMFAIRPPRRGPLGPDERAFLDKLRQSVGGA
jgi:hypothetical protein